MSERVISYQEADFFKKYAQQEVFRSIGQESSKILTEILLDYKNTPEEDFRKGVTLYRYSHHDMYMFCIYAGNVPDAFKIGNTLHPGPGKMTFDDKRKLEDFFIKNRVQICSKILADAMDEEVFKERKKKQFPF